MITITFYHKREFLAVFTLPAIPREQERITIGGVLYQVIMVTWLLEDMPNDDYNCDVRVYLKLATGTLKPKPQTN